MSKVITLKEGREYARLSAAGMYAAIERGLKAKKIGRRWYVTKEAIDEYRASRYAPEKRRHKGNLVFDIQRGYFSVQHVARVIADTLHIPYDTSKVYAKIKDGSLRASRKGAAWRVGKSDAIMLLESEKKLLVQSKNVG